MQSLRRKRVCQRICDQVSGIKPYRVRSQEKHLEKLIREQPFPIAYPVPKPHPRRGVIGMLRGLVRDLLAFFFKTK